MTDVRSDVARRRGEVTVVLNEFNRRFTLRRRLEAAVCQEGARVRHVWVCVFHQPDQQALEQLLGEFRAAYPDTEFHSILSTYDFKYWGRFQIALQAPTEYVYVVDDDIVPQRGYLAHCTSYADALNAAVGTFGWRFPDKSITHYRNGEWIASVAPGASVPAPVRVDMLCCHHFLRTEWVRHLWRDEPISFQTGEDLYLGRNLYKYGGVRSFVIPTFVEGSRCIVDDEAGVAGTTVSENIRLRDRIFDAIKGDFA